MSTIYLVTRGEYSDYHIVGAFSSRTNAEKFIELMSPGADIEEYSIDPGMDQIRQGLKPFYVWMWRTGEVMATGYTDADGVAMGKVRLYGKNQFNPGRMYTTMWAKDKDHAIKIANERRIQAIANNEWPD